MALTPESPPRARPEVEIFTDGACSGNPGPGGWGAVLQYNSTVKELKGGAPLTTNNQMELTAAIEALDAAVQKHTIEWHWVKGHNGDVMNERADQLANEGMAPFKPKRGRMEFVP